MIQKLQWKCCAILLLRRLCSGEMLRFDSITISRVMHVRWVCSGSRMLGKPPMCFLSAARRGHWSQPCVLGPRASRGFSEVLLSCFQESKAYQAGCRLWERQEGVIVGFPGTGNVGPIAR